MLSRATMPSSPKPPRVLLVSGDEAVATELADFLKEERFDVHLHIHTLEQEVRTWPCDVALVDCASKEHEGDDYLRRIPSTARPKNVVALSLERMGRVGADVTFAAPFDLDGLVNALRRMP